VADSILDSTKKILGLGADNTAFDTDVLMHINSVFATLNQLGVGPANGFAVEDATATWDEFLGADPRLNNVKIYVYLRVRVLFDPPTGSYHLINSMNEQIKELEWRISVKREDEDWVDPTPPPIPDPDNVQYIPIPVNDYMVSE
jgi:hypothetical protein